MPIKVDYYKDGRNNYAWVGGAMVKVDAAGKHPQKRRDCSPDGPGRGRPWRSPAKRFRRPRCDC